MNETPSEPDSRVIKGVSLADMDGLLVAALKGLDKKVTAVEAGVDAQGAQLLELSREVEQLRAANAALEARLGALEAAAKR
jgi:poly(3-hydroxybutyrate) depolymerase